MAKPALRRTARGRPRAAATRMGNRYTVGFTPEEHEAVTAAAAFKAMPVATWIRMAAIEVARRQAAAEGGGR